MRNREWIVAREHGQLIARNVSTRRPSLAPFYGMVLTDAAKMRLNRQYADDLKFHAEANIIDGRQNETWHIDVPIPNEIGWLTDVVI